MNNFLKIFLEVTGVTLPIFAVIAVGFFIKKKGIIKDQNVPLLNKLTYNFGLSSLVFLNIAENKLKEIFDVNILKVIFPTYFLFLIIVFLSFYFLKIKNKTKGAAIVSTYRSNMAFIGMPVLLYAYGSLATAKASIVIACLLPLNILTTALFLRLLNIQDSKDRKTGIKKLVIEIIIDPVLIAVVAGMIISYFSYEIPAPIFKFFEILSSLAVPLALISIGASFKFSHIKSNIKHLSLISFGKLILMPLLSLVFSIFIFKVGKLDRDIICILCAMPLAVATFIQSEKYNSDTDFVSSALIITTLISAVTITGWLFILRLI
ncbi:MAG: AEC family transporter [Actinobacteria bacterium]|nr:AEC family transporter [Actinomycetota bacterium]MCG2789542.1 AEC family transporter [Actinomycetes bacterium]